MRAFGTAAIGALDYVRFVSGGRYAMAWTRLLAADAAGYVRTLKAAGYFTADEEPYRKATVSLQTEFIRKLQGSEGADAPGVAVPPVEEVRTWLAPEDIDLLEAALAERAYQVADDNRLGALREMSGGDYAEPTPRDEEPLS